MDTPGAGDLIGWLNEPLHRLFGDIQLSALSESVAVADGTTVLLVSDALGEPSAVVLCSSPAAPGMIERAMVRAHRAREVLEARLGQAILRPLAEGTVHGLTYAVVPYCTPLSQGRLRWWVQRLFLRPSVLRWVLGVAQHSAREVPAAELERAFVAPLQRVAQFKALGDLISEAARLAIERLVSGAWRPRFILMHGDLWKGNILIRADRASGRVQRWRPDFVVIDWAGSRVDGYPIFDLIRVAQSMLVSPIALRHEVMRHCHVLDCAEEDVRGYLLAALGYLAANLEHFPSDQFGRMAISCFQSLNHAIG